MREAPVLARAAGDVQRFLDGIGRPSVLIGGMAVMRWGEVRATRDADFVLLTPLGEEEEVVDRVLRRFESRMADGRQFALRNRVLLIRTAGGGDVDISLGCLDFERHAIERGSDFVYPGPVTLRTICAEDLIVMKAFADRPIDWQDIRGIVDRQQGALGWDQIEAELRPLLEVKGEPELWERLNVMRRGSRTRSGRVGP